MNVLFIYPNIGTLVGFNIGVAQIAAVLRQRGHRARMLHLNEGLGFGLDLERIGRVVDELRPGLIGFSCTSSQIDAGLRIAGFLRRDLGVTVPIVFGGVHASLAPDELLAHPCVDLVCVGEGEAALAELADRLQAGADPAGVPNLWTRSEGGVTRTPLGPLAHPARLPFMDVSVDPGFQQLIDRRHGWVDVMFGRGCPHSCSYCFNKGLRQLYADHGPPGAATVRAHLRPGDPEAFVAGVRDLVRAHANVRTVSFVDDDILLYPCLPELTAAYGREVGLPFVVNASLASVRPQRLRPLREAGCELVRVGIESGAERLRRDVLQRPMSTRAIAARMAVLRRAGLRTLAYNMIGIPSETWDDVLATLRLNAELAPDALRVNMFGLYPGTDLYERCRRSGLLAASPPAPYYDYRAFGFDRGHRLRLQKVHEFFDLYLNLQDPAVEPAVRPWARRVDELDEERWSDRRVHEEVRAGLEEVSRRLAEQGTPHFATSFTPYHVVRVGAG